MIDEKFILKSKTIWGLIIAGLPQIALLFGFDFSEDDATQLDEIAMQLVSLAGLAFAWFGRVKAKNNLTL